MDNLFKDISKFQILSFPLDTQSIDHVTFSVATTSQQSSVFVNVINFFSVNTCNVRMVPNTVSTPKDSDVYSIRIF